jgi:hypothetical protein
VIEPEQYQDAFHLGAGAEEQHMTASGAEVVRGLNQGPAAGSSEQS